MFWFLIGVTFLVLIPNHTSSRRSADSKPAFDAAPVSATSGPHAGGVPVPASTRQVLTSVVRVEVPRVEPAPGRPAPADPRHDIGAARLGGPFVAKSLPAAPGVGGEPAALPPLTPLINSFPGSDDTGVIPASPDIAVGQLHIVGVANSSFFFYDRCGTLLSTQTFNDWFSDSVSTFFDPRVAYDTFDDRFVMTVAARDNGSQTAKLWIGISTDSSPWVWRFVASGFAGNWPESPDVGVDANAIYVPANVWNFAPPTFLHGQVSVVDKAALMAGGSVLNTTFSPLTNPGDGSPAQAIRAAVMHTWEGTYWLANSKPAGGDFLTLWGVTGAPAAPVLTSYNIPTGIAYTPPPDCVQPNTQLVDMGDARLGNAVYASDTLWTVHATGGPTGGFRLVRAFQVATSTQSLVTQYGIITGGVPTLYPGYPSIEFDVDGNGIVSFLTGGPAHYMSAAYIGIKRDGFSLNFDFFGAGDADYSHGGSQPWRWGASSAVARDPIDNASLWMVGAVASSNPTPSWDTQIAATSYQAPGILTVTPTGPVPFVSTGLETGPFTPQEAEYILSNAGASTLGWQLTGTDWWDVPDKTGGTLFPGQVDTVRITIDALGFIPAGTYLDNYTFEDCSIGGAVLPFSTELTVGIDGSCPGAILDMFPPFVPKIGVDGGIEVGTYITAMKDMNVCALGMAADLVLPQVVTARIYEADGTTRIGLLAEGTLTAVQPGDLVHYVPIGATLKACQDYNISFEFGAVNTWRWWSESSLGLPVDVDGAIRVRDAEEAGNPATDRLPYLSLISEAPTSTQASFLIPPGLNPPACSDATTERGVYITAARTTTLSWIAWHADLGSSPLPQELTARVYEATGTTRGPLIATGTAFQVWPQLLFWKTIPIACQLIEGQDYDIVVEYPPGVTWTCVDETGITLPFTVDDAFIVRDGELAGNASNTFLMPLLLAWSPVTAGASFHLAKPGVYPPPSVEVQPNFDYGMYVTALTDEHLYSLGWRADVPAGAVIGARVYQAAGTTRGALITSGTMLSSGPGTRWHDIPVSAELSAGSDYDFEIDITQVNEWRFWTDSSGMPYQPYGVITVVDGEQGGNAANFTLIDMRMNACDAVATGITDPKPVRPPTFSLSLHPNPTSARATLAFSLDAPEPVTITVYDVAGRRVATLLQNETRPAGPGTVQFDSRTVAAGVYFVKMQTPTKSLSRKVTVVH
ncbi:MAG: T9SS type A sorting domain-containing protein [Candidatus Krumholzibacteriia bacterium]